MLGGRLAGRGPLRVRDLDIEGRPHGVVDRSWVLDVLVENFMPRGGREFGPGGGSCRRALPAEVAASVPLRPDRRRCRAELL